MKLIIRPTKEEMGALAAKHAAKLVNDAIEKRGYARILLSTGASQFPFFKEFVKESIDWSRVEMFHLDEYVGISEEHPASFKRYLLDRFVNVVNPAKAHLINGLCAPEETIAELTMLLSEKPVDVGLIGIGENGHIAFNDPPADFNTREAYIIVDLDERCKRQQMGEGWFATIDDVPKQAVSMTPYQIMQCKVIVSCVPYAVKADAVEKTVHTKGTTPMVPSTLLKEHENFILYADADSSAKIIDIAF